MRAQLVSGQHLFLNISTVVHISLPPPQILYKMKLKWRKSNVPVVFGNDLAPLPLILCFAEMPLIRPRTDNQSPFMLRSNLPFFVTKENAAMAEILFRRFD